MSLTERFWAKVDRSDADGCWLWTAATKGNGYGVIGRGGRGRGQIYAHRLAWELEHGPIPAGLFVCHHCDNRRCVNPAHLFLGTAAENQADMTRKGRSLRGERHNLVEINESHVQEIRRLWVVGGITQKEIDRRFGIGRQHVSAIVRGKKWRHLLPSSWSPPQPKRWSRPCP